MAASREALPDRRRRKRSVVRIVAGLSLPGGVWLAALAIPAPLARSMAVHVVLMGFAAPVAAWLLAGRGRRVRRPSLTVAVGMQSLLLYAWHLPLGSAVAMQSAVGMAAMQATLFLAALRFWQAVLANLPIRWWRAVVALLVTGKLFCLLGLLLVLSPRMLGHGASNLPDQQLAGLIMLAACPATYIGAALIVCCLGIPGFIPEPSGRLRSLPL